MQSVYHRHEMERNANFYCQKFRDQTYAIVLSLKFPFIVNREKRLARIHIHIQQMQFIHISYQFHLNNFFVSWFINSGNDIFVLWCSGVGHQTTYSKLKTVTCTTEPQLKITWKQRKKCNENLYVIQIAILRWNKKIILLKWKLQ